MVLPGDWYKNVDGPNGKRIISPDDDAPTLTRLFELFATGAYSIKRLARLAREEGLTLRGRTVYASELHYILTRKIYYGAFDWNGQTYKGSHEPLVTRDVWDRVQTLLDHRNKTKVRTTRDFPFTGLVTCGHCGCQLVGELKKKRYVYWHCTGNRGKCAEPYTSDEVLTQQFASVLQDLVIPAEILDWLRTEVVTADQNEHATRDGIIRRHEEDIKRLEARIETMYLDKLDGKISDAFFDQKAGAWRAIMISDGAGLRVTFDEAGDTRQQS